MIHLSVADVAYKVLDECYEFEEGGKKIKFDYIYIYIFFFFYESLCCKYSKDTQNSRVIANINVFQLH